MTVVFPHLTLILLLHYLVKSRNRTLSVYNNEFILGIPPTLWPPNSPDLNAVDYTVWRVLQERVYRTKISDVDEL